MQSPFRPTKEATTDLLTTEEHPPVAAVEESSAVETSSVDETSEVASKSSTQDKDFYNKETVQYMFHFILNDRHYDNILSSEERSILESIITRLNKASL